VTTLEDAHVLITGGSQGIGFATAQRVLDRGGRVSIVARDAERLAAAADALERRANDPTRVCAETADVTDREGFENALGLIIAQFGPVDVLVANAGGARPRLFTDAPVDDFEQQMTLNYLGTVWPIRAVVPSMIERGGGHLVLVSSAAGLMGVVGYAAYGAAKFAVRGLAEAIRPELKPHGIVVTCVYPPDTDTPGLAAEDATKPAATRSIAALVSPRTAESVAHDIVNGIEHDRADVTCDRATALVLRAGGAGGLLSPVMRRMMDRHVRKANESADEEGRR
jgi:3-dehydrosphinganine reductase